ncbi:MAG: aminoacyl-tRNA hydrolase [Omnitrophica WOR_2 bacterium GWF2_38_59]|nr:MAG: aminoacyl-tRNA hydrolase [Omnitrophica WOR_2 bacterium GWA2_37_7]OGX22940.1 MAG: aminoacyl-tRNA hydrolase [Omnitrophica WOR_2 bacterium GWF2_38_59]OGX49749.1 MAG: aminoacyl-tRNA hydrolase [Omnitrophica WOR_2 bacterium RIFOXYA2_FULL_38_17]OGX54659.1 MAG: aminoacyl-tRNA hydrolase [Omnitrophica WOR_2 bacterium RIFOXYA12_FULL_38_10]OGX55663.1 MAG: aminoacyl-tRNA hydrolase [Omnitrophica WOR_2 bacterium RIFOXYC2_FULL_38_12]OGX60107.1 MAG: aminoacyl-tRNA hydrolase [Omnitrophica WOR_2 bacteriu
MKLIVGLGNPGKDYEYTRHNLGFLVVKHLAERLNVGWKLSSFTNGLTAEGNYRGNGFCLFLPLTYMNKSGGAVKQIIETKEFLLDESLIVCDDLNLDFEQIRIRPKGSDGGHNGLDSIIQYLCTDEFPRLRMGIGHPGNKVDVVDYVLEEFSKSEKNNLEDFIGKSADCCLIWLDEGIGKAMERFNGKSFSQE